MHGDVFLGAGGSLRRSYEDVDWSATPLGPVSSWSPALRNAVALALHTRFPVTLLWGPELVMVYNDAYLPLIADKHPAALGAPAAEVFPEAWETIGPMMEGALAGQGATWVEDAPVPLHRHGYLEECYFTFSYSPVRGEDGAIEGVMDIATETTRQVLDRRRLSLLRRVGERLGGLTHADEVPQRALPVLRADAGDLPAVDIRLSGRSGGGDPRLPAAPAGPLGDGGVTVEETPTGHVAWLPLAPAQAGELPPLLVVLLNERRPADDEYLAFLGLIALALGRALDRIHAREAERKLSEALQHSLLTTPPPSEHLQIAVRYQPAAEQAQVGGDWYDAFYVRSGALTVVIGDVAGHDQRSAVGMAQARNLLRGICYTLGKPPAPVLADLDETMRGLGVDVFATAILAQVEEDEEGLHHLRWSNAGHPPPVLLAADGSARLLQATPDLVLGVTDADRADHRAELRPGDSVVLYTDGLVERRGVALPESLAWLTGILEGRHGMSAEELCDHLIGQLEGSVEDDVALLVLQVEKS